jgi:hypothetical protein
MRWLLPFVLILLSVPAFAQCLGIDPAPPQAVAAGYTCQTYRWGSGDTAGEIDSAQTYNPGFKWYWGTANNNGHVTVGSDYSVQPSGQIITQTSVPADHGAFVLNTCGGPPASNVWTVGQFFQFGFYAEFVGEWNATGFFGVQTGFYSLDLNWYSSRPGACPSGQCFEVDDPDAFAFDQTVVFWGGGTSQGQSNVGKTFSAPTVETGTHKYGVLVTPTATTWWINDVANGSVSFDTPFVTPLGLYNSKQCFGSESTSQFPLAIDSFKVWQAGAPPVFGGGRSLRR